MTPEALKLIGGYLDYFNILYLLPMYEIKTFNYITNKWETVLTTDDFIDANDLYKRLLKEENKQGGVSLFQNGKQIKATFIPKLQK